MGATEAHAFVFQDWEIVPLSDFVKLTVTGAETAEFAGKVRRNLIPIGRAARKEALTFEALPTELGTS